MTSMRKKQPVSFAQKFPNADPLALRLLERLLAFDPKDRPTAEEVCHDFQWNIISILISKLYALYMAMEILDPSLPFFNELLFLFFSFPFKVQRIECM